MNFPQSQKLCVWCVLLLTLLSASPRTFAQTANQARVVEAVRNDQVVTLRGNIHPSARALSDRGALPATQPITRMHLLLQRSAAQEAALQGLMAQQLDPKSPNYQAWITPQQFGEQFGPADSDIQAVKDWLASQGFTDLKVNNGKTLIEFRGTTGQVQNAFHTEVHRLSVNGKEHFANMQEPQIPRALAPVVAGVRGLHNFHPKPLLRRLGKFQRNLNTGEIKPLFTFTDVNGTFYGVGPADFATIYNVPSSLNANKPGALDGSGVNIAVVGQSNVDLQDIRDYRSIFGLPVNDPQVILNGPDPGLVSGDEGESDLDLELSGAVAPGATILFVTTESSQTDGVAGVDASAQYIVDNNIAPILSESYGTCESGLGTAGNQFYASLWQQAAAQGMTVSISAGDNGSAGCDDQNTETSATHGLAVSGFASTPYNVALGGTDFNQAGQQTTYWNSSNGNGQVSAKGYIPEMVWNDSCAAAATSSNLSSVCANATASSTTEPLNIVGGSGGPSSVYTTKPSWQTGFGDSARDLPDLSLFSADGGNPSAPSNSFYITCESDADISGDTGCNLTKFSTTSPFHDFQAVGGTSAAAPAFAGIMALINQKTGQRQGNANAELYALAKAETFSSCDSGGGTSGSSSNTTCVFNDITSNKAANGNTPHLNNSVPCPGGATSCSKTSSGGFGVLTTAAGGTTVGYAVGTGYDLATGLGTPNVANMINSWSTPGATGKAATVTLSPATVTGTAGTASGNLSGTVSGSGGTPTGVVILEDAVSGSAAENGSPLGSVNLSGGSYSIAAAMLPQGTYTVKAHYSGDGTFAPADSAPISVNLSKQGSTVVVSFVNSSGAISTSSQSVAYGSPYILRVDVENQGGTACQSLSSGAGTVNFVCPTGSVSLFDGGSGHPLNDFPTAQTNNATNTARLNDRGFAEDQPIQLPAGSHTITATYTADAGSSYNSNSSSNTLSVTITQASTTTTVTSSAVSITSGQNVTLSASVGSSSNSAQGPTGTVTFMNGSTVLGSAATCTPTGATSSTGASCTATVTAAISALPPGFFVEPRPRTTPFVILAWLAAALALLSFLLTGRMAARPRRRQYAYAGVALFLMAAAALAGCGGGSSSGGGSSRTITAKYSGDTNYATSSGSVSVTVH